MKTKKSLMALVATTIFVTGQVYATGGGGGGGDVAAEDISKGQIHSGVRMASAAAAASLFSMITSVAVSVAIENPGAATLGITDAEIDSCLQGNDASCRELFDKIMKNLAKILTTNYRMAHSIHIFNPNAATYSKKRAQALAAALKKIRK
jgi:hypothetical protein